MSRSISDYYDRTTGWFRLWERSRAPIAVHRAVHGPGAVTRADALDYVHRCVLRTARSLDVSAVIDCGCGTGALLDYLARRHEFRALVGVTASRVQARGAADWFAVARDLRTRPVIRAGNFLDESQLHVDASPRLFVAIESMVHASAARLLEAVCAAAGQGDYLFICDDFLADGTRGHAPLVERFKRGWRAPGIVSAEALDQVSARAGFTRRDAEDWTAFVPRPRWAARWFHRIASAGFAPLARFPFFGNLSGGAALRAGYGFNLFRYQTRLYERSARSPAAPVDT